MNFRPGQRVRCVRQGGWRSAYELDAHGPALGQVCTVTEIEAFFVPQLAGVNTFLGIDGFPGAFYHDKCFHPLEDDQLERLRQVCADVPDRVLQPA